LCAPPAREGRQCIPKLDSLSRIAARARAEEQAFTWVIKPRSRGVRYLNTHSPPLTHSLEPVGEGVWERRLDVTVEDNAKARLGEAEMQGDNLSPPSPLISSSLEPSSPDSSADSRTSPTPAYG